MLIAEDVSRIEQPDGPQTTVRNVLYRERHHAEAGIQKVNLRLALASPSME